MTAALICAPTTAFTADGDLDRDAVRALYTHLAAYVDGVFVTGTMGEFPALNEGERLDLFQIALDVFGTDRVIAHVGTASLRDTISLASRAAGLGVRRFAAITPFFMSATPDEVRDHFRAITASVGCAWYGYFFTERTGVRLSVPEVASVIASAGLAGLKISGGETARVADYVAACPAETEVLSGNDAGLLDAVAAGGAGVVSGFSTAFPSTFRRLVDAVNIGDTAAVDAAQADVLRILAVLDGRIGAAKVALAARGLGGARARMTIQLPDEATAREIGALTQRYD